MKLQPQVSRNCFRPQPRFAFRKQSMPNAALTNIHRLQLVQRTRALDPTLESIRSRPYCVLIGPSKRLFTCRIGVKLFFRGRTSGKTIREANESSKIVNFRKHLASYLKQKLLEKYFDKIVVRIIKIGGQKNTKP